MSRNEALDAMALWEAVLTELTDADRDWWFERDEGACAVREMVLTLSPLCAMAYEHAFNVYDYSDCYDWDWCPRWLEAVQAACTTDSPEIVAKDVERMARAVVGA